MRWLVLMVWLALSGAAYSQVASDSTMCTLASPLTRLAKAVDAYVIGHPAAASMKSDDLLRAATAHDSSLLSPFERYAVVTRIEGRNSTVLVCTADQQIGLMEDAGCSPHLDAQRWRNVPAMPCGFSVDLPTACTYDAPRPTTNYCR